MLTQPQSGDRGSGASLKRGGLYQMLLGNTDVRENSHTTTVEVAVIMIIILPQSQCETGIIG